MTQVVVVKAPQDRKHTAQTESHLSLVTPALTEPHCSLLNKPPAGKTALTAEQNWRLVFNSCGRKPKEN